jgi:hypothetical protein
VVDGVQAVFFGVEHGGKGQIMNGFPQGTSKNLLRVLIASLGGARNPHVPRVQTLLKNSGFTAPSAVH